MTRVVVNEAYAAQRVTGQQRYACEIASRLPTAEFVVHRPRGFWAGSTVRVWAWVQLALPLLARGRVLLSMTSRAPLWRRRHVLVVHDLFVLSHPEWFSRRYYWTHAPLLRAQIRSAAVVVAVSRPVAEELGPLRSGTVVVAPNAPSAVFAERDREPSAYLASQGVRPGTYFLAVGSRDPRKNLRGLAQAYARLDDATRAAHPLVLVGGGAAIYRDLDISWPSGTFDAGYVDDEELRRLYRDARSVVFVSLAEGFGLPLVEAAAAGAASLLISDIEVFRWICGEGVRYVDPGSADDIERGLRAEIESPAGQALDPDRFSWDRSADVVRAACRDAARAGRVAR